ncbi:MAG TPA: transcription-repair coupling factor [Thermoanaerobaculia bacterium]
MDAAPPLVEIARALAGSVPFRALSTAVARGRGVATRLPPGAAAWVGEQLRAELGRPLLVVVPHESEARAWLEGARLVAGSETTVHFPAPSLSPYQEIDASLGVRAEEVVALARAAAGVATSLVATPRALFRRLPEPARLAGIELVRGGEIDADELAHRLAALGYRRVDLVDEPGDFAVRGEVVDLWPAGESAPVRLDRFGDEIESLRQFDVETQRSAEELATARVLPLALFPADAGAARRLARALMALVDESDEGESAELVAALEEGRGFPGWENFLPLAEPATRTLAEVMPGALVAVYDPGAVAAEVEQHAARLADELAARRAHGRFAVAPELVEHPVAAVRALLARAEWLVEPLAGRDAVDFGAAPSELFHGQLPRFPQEVAGARWRGERVLLVAAEERFAALGELLAARGVAPDARGVELVAGELERGFRLPAAGAVIYGEAQLLTRARGETRRARSRFGPFVSGLRDLRLGDYVVHADHGIGQFVGLRTVAAAAPEVELPPILRGGAPPAAPESEAVEIAYAGARRLFVPIDRLHLVQKYGGIEGIAPRLDQLGGTSWNRTKSRVKRALEEMADELLKLYAERQLARAPILAGDTDLERQFAAAFPYEETPDQAEAIATILADLEKSRPMDRLLVGDVGFGKTEVAMRAAFRAVDSGYQVAVLAPTTILADQHLETFAERFEGFAVIVERISRLRTGKDLAELRERVAQGKIDILIGTHRVLSRDIGFRRLGLLVVDEEQRFGVAQKERLKQFKRDVHVLAMTATPLPRTLQLSLAGVRDISVIETPPKDRMAVETAVLPYSDELVREAIEFELSRGGQVYYVDNRVESIEERAVHLRELVPGLRITVGHGQLDEHELYRRMHAFTAREHDLLLATTIIENGIDIPSVNTMIVHRADRFGLAQLYQLRGRVGRSRELGYCYLLVPSDRTLAPDARKRLEALRDFTELGAGFRIAARDLEIRGAGNLLGAEQSGHIAELGIETYLRMLEETVRELKGEAAAEGPSTALDLPVPVAIPRSYIADENLRLEIYRKLAAAEAPREELLAELADRFGRPPAAVEMLLDLAALKRDAERLRIQSISAGAGRLTFRLRRDSRVDVDQLIRFVSERRGSSFSPSGVLTLPLAAGESVLDAASSTLRGIAP